MSISWCSCKLTCEKKNFTNRQTRTFSTCIICGRNHRSFTGCVLSSALQTNVCVCVCVCVTHRISRHELTESTVGVLVRHKGIGYTGPETSPGTSRRQRACRGSSLSKMDTQAHIRLRTTYCTTPLARKSDAYFVQIVWGDRKYTAQERCRVRLRKLSKAYVKSPLADNWSHTWVVKCASDFVRRNHSARCAFSCDGSWLLS